MFVRNAAFMAFTVQVKILIWSLGDSLPPEALCPVAGMVKSAPPGEWCVPFVRISQTPPWLRICLPRPGRMIECGPRPGLLFEVGQFFHRTPGCIWSNVRPCVRVAWMVSPDSTVMMGGSVVSTTPKCRFGHIASTTCTAPHHRISGLLLSHRHARLLRLRWQTLGLPRPTPPIICWRAAILRRDFPRA